MWLSSRVLTCVVVVMTFLTSTMSITSDCLVTSNITVPLKDKGEFSRTFWSFLKNIKTGKFLKVRLYETQEHYISIDCNHTHVNTSEIDLLSKEPVPSSAVSVPWPVCPEWRQVKVALDGNNKLSITDIHHNRTFISKKVPFPIKDMQIEMDHFSDLCSTLTPVWKVEAGVPRVIVLPRHWEVIHFTLEANEVAKPRLIVRNATLPLGQLSTSQPRLTLSLKRTSTATLRLVMSTWDTVVEVGSAIENFTLSSPTNGGAFTLLQHLHLQECSPEAEPGEEGSSGCRCSSSCMAIFLVFLWTAAVINVTVYCCLKRLPTQTHGSSVASLRIPSDNSTLPVLHMAAPHFPRMTTNQHYPEVSGPIYEDVDDYPRLRALSRR